MLDQATLTAGLERLRARLEPDITDRAEEEPSIAADLRHRYEAARAAKRTGLSFELWRAGEVTQAAVAWLLACVFVRFLEDNHLIEQPWISGPANRLADAKEQNLLTYRAGQWKTDRDYLLLCFEEIRKLPGVSSLFDTEHNPLFRLTPTGNGARTIIDFFQKLDDHGNLVHDFSGTIDNTRFLGDLYQNISESARKRYALVQTPDFVVDFILDRTMEPALQEFGLDGFRIIDPACGSGHFLIAAFERLFHKWQQRLPPLDPIDCASRALASVYGVDLNPFAIAIARFRLLIAALRQCEVKQLSEAPNFHTNFAVGDSLLHGTRPGTLGAVQRHAFDEALNFFYETEDKGSLQEYLRHDRYHAVVGNPPYITVQDAALRDVYRERFESCYQLYQLCVPFTEAFFDLAARSAGPGYVGMITSNAFMKRTFGRKLVQSSFPKWDITHVIDTSGVYLPGYGTPTAIIFGRNSAPLSDRVRVVRGIRGEVQPPSDPANAPVWQAIVEHINRPGSTGRYVSAADALRLDFHIHPWSIGGGGAAELWSQLSKSRSKLSTVTHDIGRAVGLGEEDIWFTGSSRAHRDSLLVPIVIGEFVRDWAVHSTPALYPYNGIGGAPLPKLPYTALRRLFTFRRVLENRSMFGKTLGGWGKYWYEYLEHYSTKLKTPLSITFASVATHNHFCLDRGGKIFKETAPLIKLKAETDETEHLRVLGVTNSSTVCFWLRQVCFPKGGDKVGGDGARIRKNMWDERFAFDGAKISDIPLPATYSVDFAAAIQECVDELATNLPSKIVSEKPLAQTDLEKARIRAESLVGQMIALQEELDWDVYYLYNLTNKSITLPLTEIPAIELGQRAFEIVMARQIAEGEAETDWFNRHGSTPITEIPEHWPETYRQLIQKRIDTIGSDRDIALIEQPEYKRRWNLPKWEDLEREALRNWLLDRLEDARYWPADPPMLRTTSNLASAAAEDRDFMQVAELYTGRSDFKLGTLVAELVEKQSIPFLPILRYKGLGLTKRKQWEETWDLQRREDAGEKLAIDVPPKYEKFDFLTDTGWRLRGKLDVPKERWVSYPHLNRISDATLLIGWAGYDHAQQAFALAAFYQNVKEDGSAPSRLVPILAGILDLLPWVKQWHNAPDPATGIQAGDFLDEFLRNEVSRLNLTEDDLRNWTPPAPQKSPRAARRVKEKRS